MTWTANIPFNQYIEYGGYGAARIWGNATAILDDNRTNIHLSSYGTGCDFWSASHGNGFTNALMIAFGGIANTHQELPAYMGQSITGAGGILDQQMLSALSSGSKVVGYVWIIDNQGTGGSLHNDGVTFDWGWSESWAPGTNYITVVNRYYKGDGIAVVDAWYTGTASFPQDYFPMESKKSGAWLRNDDAGHLQIMQGGSWTNVKNRYDKTNPKMNIMSSGWKQVSR